MMVDGERVVIQAPRRSCAAPVDHQSGFQQLKSTRQRLRPPSYAITDAQGEELSDRWEEALTIRGWIEETWRELEAGE